MQHISVLFLRIVLIALLAPCAVARANESPLSSYNKFVYSVVQKIILGSAEKMPEEQYGFRPAATVRTYGEILGHIAESQYVFCAAVKGEKSPGTKVEKVKTSKADLIAALKDAFAYCQTAYDLTDKQAVETVKFHRTDTPKLFVLSTNYTHTIEHYGNLVTYMRMQGIVPPTSEPGFLEAQRR